jgi:hypothetical protein
VQVHKGFMGAPYTEARLWRTASNSGYPLVQFGWHQSLISLVTNQNAPLTLWSELKPCPRICPRLHRTRRNWTGLPERHRHRSTANGFAEAILSPETGVRIPVAVLRKAETPGCRGFSFSRWQPQRSRRSLGLIRTSVELQSHGMKADIECVSGVVGGEAP